MCTKFDEDCKGQSNRELHADFVSLFESAPELTLGPEIGSAIKRRNATDDQVKTALELIVRGMILEKKLEGTRQEERMEALMDSNKFRGIVMCMPMDHSVVRSWLNARWHAQEQIEEDRRTSSKTPSMVFSSQNLPEVPSDGKDHEPRVRLLQYKVLQAIRSLPDTPAKNITSIRKALSKSTKLSYKAMTIKETLALTYPTTVIDAMGEFEMFDCFLGKCQEGLNLAEMLDEQISVCKRELIQNKGESAADFAARAENAMSLFEELLRGSGFTNDQDGVDKYSTDRKRSQVIIAGLRPVHFGMITQIFSGKNDKHRYSTVSGTADKPALAASLLEADSLVKTQNLGDPEWGEQSYKGKEDKKDKGKDSAKQHWDKVTKAEVKNLKAIDSGKRSIRVLGTCSSLSTTGRREPVQSDASTLVVPNSAHVHGNSMMGYAIGRDANHLTERKWQRPLQGTRRGGTHGGGQSRLLLTPSNQAHR